MEQSGISIISPGVTESSVGKSKSIGITLRTNGTIQSAKEKLKAPWLKKTDEGSTWDKFLILLAEMIGTAIFIFVGCMGALGNMKPYNEIGHTTSVIELGLAFGLAVMVAIQCVGHISGADLNPAVTIASVLVGKKSVTMAGFYIIVQCLGSLLGFGLLKMITPSNLIHDGDPKTINKFCTNDINNKEVSLAQGVAAEALATGILVFFACGCWDSRNAKNSDSVGLRFGLCITVLALAFIPHTGCSLNPARTFGPAIWNNYWENHWIYWVGPIGGSIIAALIYRCLFSPSTKNQENTMQDVGTLNGIET